MSNGIDMMTPPGHFEPHCFHPTVGELGPFKLSSSMEPDDLDLIHWLPVIGSNSATATFLKNAPLLFPSVFVEDCQSSDVEFDDDEETLASTVLNSAEVDTE